MPENESNPPIKFDEWHALMGTAQARKLVQDIARHGRVPQSVNFPGAPESVPLGRDGLPMLPLLSKINYRGAVLNNADVVAEIGKALGVAKPLEVGVKDARVLPGKQVTMIGRNADDTPRMAFGELTIGSDGRVTSIRNAMSFDGTPPKEVALSDATQKALSDAIASLEHAPKRRTDMDFEL